MSSRAPLQEIPPFASLQYSARFNAESLGGFRTMADPISDEVVARLGERGSMEHVHDLLGETRRRAREEGGVYQEFLDACDQVPSWADFAAMETGQRMIAAFPIHMGIALGSGSLVGGAVFRKMALITAMTGMLGGDSSRRLRETSALVIRMAFPGSLQPGGEAHELLVRVRLLHSAIRRHLKETGRFEHPVELPINQQDLAITLGLFGYLSVRSLAKMGIHFRQRELASYMLLWRYAGHVLGIVPALLPDTIEDQREFFNASLKHQAHPDRMSPAIKKVLDDMAQGFARSVPGLSYEQARTFLHQTCRWLSGNDYVTGMQIEDLGEYWAIRALKLSGRAYHHMWRHVPGGAGLLYRRGAERFERMLEGMDKRKDAGGEYRVRIRSTWA